MNQVTKLMKKHKSIRQFSEKEISQEIIEDILRSAQQQPTSIGAQQASVIVIRDKEKIKKIANDVCGGQKQVENANVFMVICADFYKTNIASEIGGFDQIVQNTTEGLLIGAVEAGITVEALNVAAESHGLGAVMIGAIRNNPKLMIEILDLPKYTFPMVGISLGYPAEGVDKEIKPRLDLSTYAHYEEYDSSDIEKHIKDYNNVISDYNNSKYNVKRTYSESVGKYYSNENYRDVLKVLKKQGFKVK